MSSDACDRTKTPLNVEMNHKAPVNALVEYKGLQNACREAHPAPVQRDYRYLKPPLRLVMPQIFFPTDCELKLNLCHVSSNLPDHPLPRRA